MQLNDGEREWYEHLCDEYMAAQAVPELVRATSLPIAGDAADMLTFLEGTSDEQWARFMRELMTAAREYGHSKGEMLICETFAAASPPFSRIWELLSAHAPQVGEGDLLDSICFGMTSCEEPVFHLPHGYAQRANDGTESIFLFEGREGSWTGYQVRDLKILFILILPVLIRCACTSMAEQGALAALRGFFLEAWKKRRDDAKARFEDAQYMLPCEDHGAHLHRQLQVFSFGEGALKRNYRVRRVYPSSRINENRAAFDAGVEHYAKQQSCTLCTGAYPEDAFFARPDINLMYRPFLEVAEEVLRNEGLDQVLVSLGDVLCLLTHERFIEES